MTDLASQKALTRSAPNLPLSWYFDPRVAQIEDKLLFASDYGIWTPKWIIDKFMAFELPDEIAKETGVSLNLQAKKKILGLNAARLYGIDIEAQKKKLWTGEAAIAA